MLCLVILETEKMTTPFCVTSTKAEHCDVKTRTFVLVCTFVPPEFITSVENLNIEYPAEANSHGEPYISHV